MSTPTLFAYLPTDVAESICKLAEDSKAKKVTRTVASGLAGLGLGTLAGGGAAHGVRKGYEHFTGKKIPKGPLSAAVPVIGGAAGLAYSLYKAQELEEMRSALESTSHKPSGVGPTE